MNVPLVRGLLALLRDARAAVVGVVVLAGIAGSGALLHNHVRLRAWVSILLLVVVVLVVVASDWRRTVERDRAMLAKGELLNAEKRAREAERAASAQPPEPPMRPDVREVLRLVEALRGTILRRIDQYVGMSGIDATVDETFRLRYLIRRVRSLMEPLPEEFARLLATYNPPPGQVPVVQDVLSGLDQIEVEVTNWWESESM